MFLPRRPFVVLTAVALAACNAGTEEKLPGERDESPQQFPDEYREAARALSIGSRAIDAEDRTQFEREIICVIALDTLVENMASRGLFSDAQISAVRQARSLFERRASAEAAKANKSVSDIDRERSEIEKSVPDFRERAQLSIGCLRQLESGV